MFSVICYISPPLWSLDTEEGVGEGGEGEDGQEEEGGGQAGGTRVRLSRLVSLAAHVEGAQAELVSLQGGVELRKLASVKHQVASGVKFPP